MQKNDLVPELETRCRERLFADPADSDARLQLARSLFLRAYHCATDDKLFPICASEQEPERALLKESLMQAAVAALLCAGAAQRETARKIAERARELGAGEVADEAERETQAMQRHLEQALGVRH